MSAPWFGTPPGGWQIRPLGYFFRERKETVSDEDYPPLSVTMNGVVPQLETAAKSDNGDNRRLVREGDFVINSRSDRKGSAGLAEQDGSVSLISIVMTPRAIDGRFAHYLLRSPVFQEEFYRWGNGIVADLWSTRYAAMKRIQLAVPPPDEQLAIAEFLDRETAHMDAVIDAQESLVELLAERRRAVVVRSVAGAVESRGDATQGGLAWSGDVPAHWTTGNIRRFAAMKTGHTPSRQVSEFWEDCTIPWFTLADVWQLRAGRTHVDTTSQRISRLGLANSAAELLPAGTVMLSRTASVGFSGIMSVPMATSQDYWNWVCGPRLVPEYLLYSLRAMSDHLRSLTAGSTHKTIYEADAASLSVLVPPIGEQREIVDYLERATAAIDTMIAKTQESIALMKERRAALISAAVTGRIDVRTGTEQVERELEEARA